MVRATPCALSVIRGRRTRGAGFLSFDDSRDYMRSMGLKSAAEWRAWCREGKRPDSIPTHPHAVYSSTGWKGIPDWLGYEFQPGSGYKIPFPAHQPMLTAVSAREAFFARVGCLREEFDLESLPHSGSAQFVYKRRADRLWCPLVLRSKENVRSLKGQRLFLEAPKIHHGSGIFFLFRESQKLFFFPDAFLAERRHRTSASAANQRLYFAVDLEHDRDEAQRHELVDDGAIRNALEESYSGSRLFEENSLGHLFCRPRDTVREQLGYQAVKFLRSACDMSVQRPSSKFVAAHYVMDAHPVWTRICTPRWHQPEVLHLQLRLHENGAFSQGLVAHCVKEQRPAFILALVCECRIEGIMVNQKKGEVPQLPGFFIFPLAYLLKIGMFSSRHDGALAGRESLYIYPPGKMPTTALGKRRACERDQFFVNLASGADLSEAAKKVHQIVSCYGEVPAPGSTTGCNH